MDMPKGDKLVLRGLKFHGYHGVKQEERKLGQKFLVDVDAWMDLRSAGESDCLSDTLSYTDIYSFLDIPSYMGILMPLLEALVISYFLEETLDYCLIIIYLRVVHFAPKGGI
nr:dihydroneopterin aldolase isoform X2 [Solanum lycopersicum]